MPGTPVEEHAAAVDRDMKKLKDSMKGLQIRQAGFKKDHDNLAKAVASFSVALIEAEALTRTQRERGTRNGRGGNGGRASGGKSTGGTSGGKR